MEYSSTVVDLQRLSNECSPLDVLYERHRITSSDSRHPRVVDSVVSPFREMRRDSVYTLKRANLVSVASQTILRLLEQAHIYYWWIPYKVRVSLSPLSKAYWETVAHTDDVWQIVTAPGTQIRHDSCWSEVDDITRRFEFSSESATTHFPLYYEIIDKRYVRYGANYTARTVQPFEPSGKKLVSRHFC